MKYEVYVFLEVKAFCRENASVESHCMKEYCSACMSEKASAQAYEICLYPRRQSRPGNSM